MIRTSVVKLSDGLGVAYRRKMPSGGSSIVIVRLDSEQPGVALISKSTGEAIISDNTTVELFSQEAFKEAMELTAGLPFKKLGGVKLEGEAIEEAAPEKEETPEEEADEVIVNSKDYQKIVDEYTDKNGKLSYQLLNRDLIQYAHGSNKVREMVAAGESVEDIRLYVVGNKFRSITGNSNLSDEEVLKIAELLDEVSPKGVFRELNEEIRRSLSTAK